MALPWVRLDSAIPQHDKMLNLISDPSPKKWQAAASYMFGLAWAGGAGTDGHIPIAALPFVHGTKETARLLEKYHLWIAASQGGYQIRNYDTRQELLIVSEAKRAAKRAGGIKGNCVKHHGPDCGCWKTTLDRLA